MSAEDPNLQWRLGQDLSRALPINVKFTAYHLSTPPTRCEALFAAPPDVEPERTYCEHHFLTIAVENDESKKNDGPGTKQHVLAFAIEVLIYTTRTLTTLFVAKADSTGHLCLAQLAPGTPSLFKNLTSTFLKHLIRTRTRPGVKLVIALFARAQDQYLFPGSAENDSKHVLDDGALIRWWCRVLDPVLRHRGPREAEAEAGTKNDEERERTTSSAYLLVPGLDASQTSHLLPSTARADPKSSPRWIVGHPLRSLAAREGIPPRCLIPRFPDDPKARFADALDEELFELTGNDAQLSPSKSRGQAQWKSIRTLEHFWEAMEFRQECSSGRLVGFIWVVIPSDGLDMDRTEQAQNPSSVASKAEIVLTPPESKSEHGEPDDIQKSGDLEDTPKKTRRLSNTSSARPDARKRRLSDEGSPRHARSPRPERHGPYKLSGPIIPRLPRIKKDLSLSSKSILNQPSIQTPYYLWTEAGRGQIVLTLPDYARATEFLLRLDFTGSETACASTARWLQEVRAVTPVSRSDNWGQLVLGQRPISPLGTASASTLPDNGPVNVLGAGMIRKKRKDGVPEVGGTATDKLVLPVNVLSGGLVREKPKPSQG
ncbi:MAG: hypothetical protein M1826_006921 [Phylliscum demangeonii]|nr:MAG: hypothetical protein M1826_006921 [Phylliscum demangeonii]